MAKTGLQPTKDQSLVSRASGGDREAFGELYDRYVTPVYRHMYCIVNDRQLAEDLTAQAFLQALQAIGRYEERGLPFLAWLLRIARNLAINHWRVQGNHNSSRNDGSDRASLSPELFCEAKLREEEVWRAVRSLGGDQRQVIILRFVDGLSYPEVAQVLAKSIGAVRVIQYRALSALRRALEDGDLGHNFPGSGGLS